MDGEPAAVPTPSRTRLKIAVSVVTLVWLAVQFTAGVLERDHAYPATGFSMFSHPTQGRLVDLELVGTAAGGSTVVITPEELGLTHLQLRSFLAREVGASAEGVRDGATARLERIAAIHEERSEVRLDDLAAVRVERSIDRDEPLRDVVTTWSR